MEQNKVGSSASRTKLNHMPFQKRRQLERDIEHITEEMYKRNKELADTNKTLSLLRTIDALVLESHASLKMVCEHIAQAIAQATGYPFVGLLTRSARTKDVVVLNGASGGADPSRNFQPEAMFNKTLHIKLTHPWFK